MLSRKKKYLQIALNSTLDEAKRIVYQLPVSDRIILEAGTPLLKRYGAGAIREISSWWQQRAMGVDIVQPSSPSSLTELFQAFKNAQAQQKNARGVAEKIMGTYIVADYKAMDRGAAEVEIAASAGANAITVLGQAPVETIDILIEACRKRSIDSIVDMMNVEKPYNVLRKLRNLPQIVMLHRGVDETEAGNKPFPIHMINKVKGAFDVMIAIGGGDSIRQVQSAVFNGADVVMVWKEFYHAKDNTAEIAKEFLHEIK
jgi:bifunctional enzyme Fae/Hps